MRTSATTTKRTMTPSSTAMPMTMPSTMMRMMARMLMKGKMMLSLLLWLSLLLSVECYPGMGRRDDIDSRPRLLRSKEIANMIVDMRRYDYRLVRSTLQPSMHNDHYYHGIDTDDENEDEGENNNQKIQEQIQIIQEKQYQYCPYKIPSLLMTLCTSTVALPNITDTTTDTTSSTDPSPSTSTSLLSLDRMIVDLYTRGLAAEALGLCMLDQPIFQQQIINNATFLSANDNNANNNNDNDNNSNNKPLLNKIQQQQLIGHTMAEGLLKLIRQAVQTYYIIIKEEQQKDQQQQQNQQQQQQQGLTSSILTSISQAAETIWISSYHHSEHLSNYIENNVIDVLAEWIVRASSALPNIANNNNDNNNDNDNQHNTISNIKYPYYPARSVMWSLAALENMAANYCDNELGYCIWHWRSHQEETEAAEAMTMTSHGSDNDDTGDDDDDDDTDNLLMDKDSSLSANVEDEEEDDALILDKDTSIIKSPELAEYVRERIVEYPNLLDIIIDWTCHGPIKEKPNDTYGWPGDVQIYKDTKTLNTVSTQLYSTSIVPWSATGIIKNLLLSQNRTLREYVKSRQQQQQQPSQKDLQQCLCDMTTYSPDWLESSKASDAIYFWSSKETRDICYDIYKTCQDDYLWENVETGDKCEQYTINRWCIEFGNDVNSYGKTANEACCLCGGGDPFILHDEL